MAIGNAIYIFGIWNDYIYTVIFETLHLKGDFLLVQRMEQFRHSPILKFTHFPCLIAGKKHMNF